jgi:hypothetical protein
MNRITFYVMNDHNSALLFPPHLIPSLRDLRGEIWRDFVDHVSQLEPTHLDRLAFGLMMIRLAGCANCQTDSYRAMQGCLQCTTQAIRRFRGSEANMQQQFEEAKKDVEQYLSKNV